MLSTVKSHNKSALTELSIKQREMLMAYRNDVCRREWPTLAEILRIKDEGPGSPNKQRRRLT